MGSWFGDFFRSKELKELFRRSMFFLCITLFTAVLHGVVLILERFGFKGPVVNILNAIKYALLAVEGATIILLSIIGGVVACKAAWPVVRRRGPRP